MKVDVYEGTINVERGFLADLIGLIKEKSFASFIRDNEVSDDILDFLCEVGTDQIKLAVIYRQNGSLDYFKKSLANASLNVKCEIARYENTPLEILEELLKEKVTKLTYAKKKKKNPIMLRKMSKSESDEIRKIVAANEYTPEDIVEDFFQKENDKVLMCKRAKEPFKGKFNLVGGKVESGENELTAAYRELQEETGITAKDIDLTHLMNFEYKISDMELEVFVRKIE